MLTSRLTHIVTFAYQTETQDDVTGNTVISWTSDSDMTDISAEVLTGPGRELLTAGAKHEDASARIVVRYDEVPALDPSWRVTWDGNDYDIVSAERDRTGRREWRLIVKSIGDGL